MHAASGLNHTVFTVNLRRFCVLCLNSVRGDFILPFVSELQRGVASSSYSHQRWISIDSLTYPNVVIRAA